MNLYSNLTEVCHLFYKHYFPHQKIAARLDAVLKKHGCRKIVFIGGLIYVADILRRKGHDITFVDYTKEMLAEAKPVLKGVSFHLGDMRNLSLEDKYDAVLAIGRSFTYMYSDKDALKALRSFSRHLKAEGIVIIDNYEIGKIDKGNYFGGTLRTKWKNISIKRLSSIQRKKKNPAIYRWDCVYEKTTRNKSERYIDEGHLLRGFTKNEIEKLISKSGLKFICHTPNFERKSFISVGRK